MKQLKLLVFICIITFAASCGQQKKYVSYKVKDGETMRTIAKRLDMKTRDLLRLNPDVGRRPDVNTVIIVPNKKNVSDNASADESIEVKKDSITNTDSDTKKDSLKIIDELKKEFVIHQVKKGDTFYSLTRFYNVSENDLNFLNPELVNGLKVGQVIKVKPIEDETENEIYEDVIERTTAINVAMLMPFKSQDLDTLSAKDAFERVRKNRLANIVTDFYMGAEIAIDSLRKQGVSINLEVFDTGKKQSKVREIIEKNSFDETNVIIGPLYSEEVNIVANKVDIPVIYPHYSKKQSYFSSSKIVKTAPEKKIYLNELVNYISKKYNGENLIIVGDGKWQSNLAVNKSVELLKKHDSINEVSILKPTKGYISKESFLKVLKPEVENWVILTTNDNGISFDVVNSLIGLPKEEEVTAEGNKVVPLYAKLFSIEKGTSFDKIENNKLAQIGFTYVNDSYIDENAYSTKMFNNQYKEKNFVLPSKYATKGFDVTYDILMRLASGESLKETFKKGTSYRIERKFEYSKKLFSTTENNGLFIIQYNPDLSLTRLK